MSVPITQDLLVKPKTANTVKDRKNRPSSASFEDKTVAEISMKEFLDFLKISYQVNEAIDSSIGEDLEKATVDWQKLTSDSLIKRLKGELDCER